jgi:flagellar assembly protein FliH
LLESESTTRSGIRSGRQARIEAFEYPADSGEPYQPAWGEWTSAEPETGQEKSHASATEDGMHRPDEARLHAEFDQRLTEETRRSFEAGREKGRQEGRQAEREAQAAALATAEERRGAQAAELIESFSTERDRYLQAVEHEVVDLALAVAARILRREAQMDPLLLTGAVRVALGQLSASTQVRLRVPAAELEMWTASVALFPNLPVKPTVLAGEGMRLGDCAIETELGSVDLGIRSQLGEIERGFFDRAGGRPASPRVPAQEAENLGVEVAR